MPKSAYLASREGPARMLACRLHPGDDLKLSLLGMLEEFGIAAGVIVSLVGSLSAARLRMAGGDSVRDLDGPLEIVSATGTIGSKACHVHLALSDSMGTTYGGHLLDGCRVFTTVELVMLDLSASWTFDRLHDPDTGYLELSITPGPAVK